MAEHTELLAYLKSIEEISTETRNEVKALYKELVGKVDRCYCVNQCQKRWVSRSYFAGGSIAAGFIVGVLAFWKDIQQLFGVRAP